MPLSEEATRRLADLGFTTDEQLGFWRWMWDQEESFFWDWVRQEEATAAEYRRWFPRLQAFAADCRRATPAPDHGRMPPAEREQARVLAAKMQELVSGASVDRRWVLNPTPNHAVIVFTNRVGLAAADEFFSGSGAVVLTDDEDDRWFREAYPGGGAGPWWYATAWWTLTEGLPEADAESLRARYPVPPGSDYWEVKVGSALSPLGGGAIHELWWWDGARAEFITVSAVVTF